ncbi:MAG: class I SAM-dependent methyltransferase [Vicinamibacterales bacterium]
MEHPDRHRAGDAIAIDGDYQARAIVSPRRAQRFWHEAKLRLIDRVAPALSDSRIADAGCGSGVIAAHLAKRAAVVTGFDLNSAAVAFATQTFGSETLRFVLGPFERIPDYGPFDQIYCIEVLEHMYEEQAVETLRVFAQAARPGGELFVTTPNVRSAWPAIEWTLDRLSLVPKLNEAQHLTLFSRVTLARAFRQAGWVIEEIGTFNGLAPFLAPVSARAASLVERMEFVGRRQLPLNLLYCRASLPRGTGSRQP